MKFLSLCSGIEAASVALCPLGWEAVAFSEIEPFPCAVLAHHYPNVPNLGDMTKWREWPEELLAEVEALLGGTPCQAFSVAGLRNSLADDRGNLTLIYVEIANHINAIRARLGRPPIVLLWENVPGVLSTADNAFGCFLGGLAGEDVPIEPPGGRWSDAGYVRGPARAIAWRLLDAQYFGLAQRRERVFVVAGSGNFRPEEVLFELEGVRRDSAPGRTSREVAPTIPARSTAGGGLGTDFDCDGGVIKATWWDGGQVSQTLDAVLAKGQTMPEKNRFPAVLVPMAFDSRQDPVNSEVVFGALGSSSPQAQAVCFDTTQITSKDNRSNPQPGDPCHPLAAGAHPPAIAFNLCGRDGGAMPELDPDGLACQRAASGGSSRSYVAHALRGEGFDASEDGTGRGTPLVPAGTAVRRLTPRECERLQGFPDDFTLIPWRGKTADQCPDGPRYKALGNSWPVPVISWIGKRIDAHRKS